jgi:hypothetical protein
MNNKNVCTPEFADAIGYRYGFHKGKVLTLNAIVLGQLYGLVKKYGEDLVLRAWEIWLDQRNTENLLFPVTIFSKEISAAIAIAELETAGQR